MAADFLKSSEGGICATHSPSIEHPLLVGPSTGEERNTHRRHIVPIACWRVEDMRFEFDSSFVRPEMNPELRDLAGLVDYVREKYPGDPPASLSVFGHADPTGKDDYNKELSGRRATAVYAMLTRNPDLWEDLYANPLGGDEWGVQSIQTMLAATGYDPGPVDGVAGSHTEAAVEQFQTDHGLTVDGKAGPITRRELFLAYMDAVCTRDDGSPFSLEPGDFLAAGADPDGKGDYQGCGEFNPVLVFSDEEQQEYSRPGNKEQRDADNAPNRRVVAFMFRAGIRINPDRWPCSRVREGVEACKKRFWSDGETRRSTQAERREFKDTKDTFACRFYHRLASESPCEGVVPVVTPWQATWDRPKVCDGAVARMILHAPGLEAGQPVVFEVTQVDFGVVGKVETISQAGGAEAPWDDWYDPERPERVTRHVQLREGDPFPIVEFTFTATAGNRIEASDTLVYEDTLRLQVVYRIDGDVYHPAREREYTIYSPWGSRAGLTRELDGGEGWAVEDGLPPGGVSLVLGQFTLIAG